MSKAYTKEQVQEMILSHLHQVARYWATQTGGSCEEKINGAIFSVLAMLDGATDLPAMDIILRPHPDDREYCLKGGENYFKNGMAINDDVMLHEMWSEGE
jgi:hypothetical protein